MIDKSLLPEFSMDVTSNLDSSPFANERESGPASRTPRNPGVVLDDYRGLIRSDADFEKFIDVFEAAILSGLMTPIFGKERHLAMLVSPAAAKRHVQDRMLLRMLEKPALLDEMKDRLENDEIVA
jgi:hypothetical protein